MAVRLDIRPRLTLREERVTKVRARRFRLPPLAFPAMGYWLGMGALTYAFAHLGEHPLDSALASELATQPAPPAAPASEVALAERAPEPQPEPEPALLTATTSEPEPAPAPERETVSEPVATGATEPVERDRERERDNREAGRRGEREAEDSSSSRAEPPAPRVAMSFPEFTDSSRPREGERASSGPRIESELFGGAHSDPSRPGPSETSPPPSSDPNAPAVASSCEAAVARNQEEYRIGAAQGAPDTSRQAYANILENGRYLAGCSIPERTVFEICAAVKNGRSVGITVSSNPSSPALDACVRRAVSRLKFPQNQRLDVTRTRFDAVRR